MISIIVDSLKRRYKLKLLRTILNLIRYLWIKIRFRFVHVGFGSYIPSSCKITGSSCIELGRNVTMSKDCWLSVPNWLIYGKKAGLTIKIGDNTSFEKRCSITAANKIHIGENVLFAPNVFITDHNHNYEDITQPIKLQGWTNDGYVIIGKNCWIGTGVVINGSKGITIGNGSVIGQNAVVTKDIPPFSVAVGNPAKIIKRYNPLTKIWERIC